MKLHKPSKKQVLFAALLVFLMGNIAASGYTLMQVKDIDKKVTDLSANHEELSNNYYGVGAEYSSEKGIQGVDFEILSQEVKELRIYDYVASDQNTQQYKTAKVRVLRVKVTNNTGSLYSAYSIATVSENGVVLRTIEVHPQDDLNGESSFGYGLELKDGGVAERYFYFIDNGIEITEIGDIDSGGI